MDKKQSRLRRSKKARAKIRKLGVPRLSVHRTPRHIYAQVIVEDTNGDKIVAAASSLDKQLQGKLNETKTKTAELVGALVAERAKKSGIERVAFDRSGFKFHGRVKTLADAARAAGLQF